MFGFHGGGPSIEDMWKAEEKLSLEERRKRYKCRNKFVQPEDIPSWATYLDELRERQRKEREDKEPKEKEEEQEKDEDGEKEKEEHKDKEPEKSEASKGQTIKPSGADDSKKKVTKEIKETKKKAIEELDREKELQDLNAHFPADAELNDKVALWRGDITTLEIDAIVNAAKRSLLGGGGIDGAIHRAAGAKLVEECMKLGGCGTGGCKTTRGYRLPAKLVLHTVGPRGERPKKLRQCYTNCLDVAAANDARVLAFCGISTGIYGYPLYRATRIALDAVRRWLEQGDNRTKIDKIIFCVFLEKEKDCYELMMPKFFPKEGDPVVQLSTEEVEKMLLQEEEFEEGEEEDDDPARMKESATSTTPVIVYLGLAMVVVVAAYFLKASW